MSASAPEPLGDCRVCGDPSWLADETGPVHLCCATVPEGETCGACSMSRALNRDAGRRTKRMAGIRARQSKADEEDG